MPMAAGAYADASRPTEVKGAMRIAEVIKFDRLDDFTVRDIQRRNLSGLGTSAEINLALNVLIDSDWVTATKQQTSGRPRRVFATNPRVWR